RSHAVTSLTLPAPAAQDEGRVWAVGQGDLCPPGPPWTRPRRGFLSTTVPRGTTAMKVPIHKLILVIGGTGAQGLAVVKALLEPTSERASSPYAVRILTRNPEHPKVKAEFNHPNIELVQGSFTDLAKVEHALEGAWGAYINTDGFTVGEKGETYYGLRIFELALRLPTPQ